MLIMRKTANVAAGVFLISGLAVLAQQGDPITSART